MDFYTCSVTITTPPMIGGEWRAQNDGCGVAAASRQD
jgi:hypothetical protein